MCIAILNTKTVTLKKDLLRNCWENNGDGAGILYIDKKQLKVFKEMTSFDNFYKNYMDIRHRYGRNNMVLHFRISTHGRVNETNCHPFLVDNNIGFVHNGMIYDVPNSTEFSDTYMFNETILKNLKVGFEHNDTVLDMLQSFIGSGSKLIFLNKDNHYAIVNEKAGHWNMGCWFSNNSYKKVNDYVDFGGTRRYKSSLGYGSYNYGSYGSYAKTNYGSYGTLAKSPAKTSWWSADDSKDEICTDCGQRLYGVSELDRGTCHFCHEEEQYLIGLNKKKVDTCEWCQKEAELTFSPDYNSEVCDECLNWVSPTKGA